MRKLKQVVLTRETHQRLRVLAAQRGITMRELVAEMVADMEGENGTERGGLDVGRNSHTDNIERNRTP